MVTCPMDIIHMRTHKHLYYPVCLKLSNCDHMTEPPAVYFKIFRKLTKLCSRENALSFDCICGLTPIAFFLSCLSGGSIILYVRGGIKKKNCFLDTQVSLAPTHVSPLVRWLVILLNFHSVSVSGPSQSVHRDL